jgi:hypothetical protein
VYILGGQSDILNARTVSLLQFEVIPVTFSFITLHACLFIARTKPQCLSPIANACALLTNTSTTKKRGCKSIPRFTFVMAIFSPFRFGAFLRNCSGFSRLFRTLFECYFRFLTQFTYSSFVAKQAGKSCFDFWSYDFYFKVSGLGSNSLLTRNFEI